MPIDESSMEDIVPIVHSLREDLAAHPEVGPDVSRTAEKVVEHLERTSLRVRSRAGFPEQSAMGVVADLRALSGDRTVALVADMSAQNVRQEGRSAGRAGQRCSHVAGNDAHTAMLVGAALLLHRADVPCNIRFIWQSGGEMLSDGAQAMIRDGALTDVDEVYAVHLWPGLALGTVGIATGPIMASLDRFYLRVRGEEAPRPWHHRRLDGIRIGAAIVQDIDRMNAEQATGSQAGAHCMVTHFLAAQDGEALAPDEVVLEGEIRAFSEEERRAAGRRLAETAEARAHALGGTAKLSIRARGNVTTNADETVERVRERLLRLVDEEHLQRVQPTAFSTGLAGYFETAPGAVVPLGCGGDTTEPANLLLSPTFTFDDGCLDLGIRVLATLALRA